MPATLVCPHCRGAVTVPDELMGGAVTCPHCRGVFAAALPLPPPPPAPVRARPVKKDPFAFDEPNRDADDEEYGPRRRSRSPRPEAQPQTYKLTAASWVVLLATAALILVLGTVRANLPPAPPGQIDLPRAVVSGLMGGTLIAGIAIGRAVGIPNGRRQYRRRR